MKDGPSLRVVERGGTVQGAQEEGRKEQARGGLKSQTPSQLTTCTCNHIKEEKST